MKINLKVTGLDEAKRHNAAMEKQFRFAAAVALTRTAKDIEAKLKGDMAGAFSSASPYTMKSTFATSAKKTNLEAVVGIKDKAPARGTAPATLLKEHFAPGGAARGQKPMERALSAIGALPKGWRVTVGGGMPTDSYGNPRRQVITEILGAIKSRMGVHKGRGKRMQTIGYFVVQPGSGSHLYPGVWWRSARKIKPMLAFVPEARYEQRVDLDKIGRTTAQKMFDKHLDAALAGAIRTAR